MDTYALAEMPGIGNKDECGACGESAGVAYTTRYAMWMCGICYDAIAKEDEEVRE